MEKLDKLKTLWVEYKYAYIDKYLQINTKIK